MNHLVMAVPNDPELAAWIGKKGSVNGITFYNRRLEETILTVLTPTSLEDKFYALPEVISLGGVVVISTREINANFGEAVIAVDADEEARHPDGRQRRQRHHREAGPKVRGNESERDAGGAAQGSREEGKGELRIAIDKAFPVKGVGTVLLGVVQSGIVGAHDKLFLGSGKELQVRSIQVQDEDCQSAAEGARVGLSVKGVDDKDLEKGEVLAKHPIKPVGEFNASLALSPMQKEISAETQYTLVTGFADAPCKLLKEGDRYVVKLGKPIQMEKGQRFIIIREKSPRVLCGGEVL